MGIVREENRTKISQGSKEKRWNCPQMGITWICWNS